MKNVIPCLFTSGNLSFGVLSMIMTLHGLYTWAGVCILLAMVCDACDGRSARALGVAGDFGKELDSLSDVVSFGAASAFLIYSYSLQSLGWIGAIPAIIYAALGGIRLARFNLNTGVIHGYFQGMPIPNGGCLIATYVISGAVLPAWLLAIFVVRILIARGFEYARNLIRHAPRGAADHTRGRRRHCPQSFHRLFPAVLLGEPDGDVGELMRDGWVPLG